MEQASLKNPAFITDDKKLESAKNTILLGIEKYNDEYRVQISKPDFKDGIIEYNNNFIFLTQQPFLDGAYEDAFYCASGIDENGDDYQINWEITNSDSDCDDESDMCDWDNFTITKL